MMQRIAFNHSSLLAAALLLGSATLAMAQAAPRRTAQAAPARKAPVGDPYGFEVQINARANEAKQAELKAQVREVEAQIERAQADLDKLQAALQQQILQARQHIAVLSEKRKALLALASTAESHVRYRYLSAVESVPIQYRIGVSLDNASESKLGVRVAEVQPKSPANKAGIQAGDYIQAINNIKVRDFRALQLLIQAAGGQKLVFVISRKQSDDKVEAVALTVTPVKVESTAAYRPTATARLRMPSPEELRKAKQTMTPQQFAKWLSQRAGGPVRVEKDGENYLLVPGGAPAAGAIQFQAIDQRLRRLEKLVESLVESQKKK